MTSTYVNDLRLNEMATGDQSGSWGTVTNTNLELIAEAFSFGTEGITTNADTHTTTIADGATDPGRSMFLKYTGTLDSACTITIAPNTVSKLWFIENATSGSQNIIISQGSGANVTIPAGQTKSVYSDGAGSGAAIVDAFATLNVVDLLVDDVLTTTAAAVFNGGFASNVASTIIAADGASDNQYVAKIHNLESTNDRSWGLEIQAGSTAADLALSIETHDSGTNLLQVAGSGQVRFVDGTASLPAISNLGDLNTGILFPAADEVGISAGGTQRLNVSATGIDITGGFTANQESTIIAADGAADNAWALQIKNQEATDDRSFGVLIQAGSTATDAPLRISTHDGGTTLFNLSGAGQAQFLDGTASLPAISNLGDLNTGIFFPAADEIAFTEGGVEAARFDSSGRLLLSHTANVAVAGHNAALQITSAGADDYHNATLAIVGNSANSNGAYINLASSRSNSAGGVTIVQEDDTLGLILFAGADGGDLTSYGASIGAFVDGTPGSNDMPGRLVFSTTADGAAGSTARMTIDSSGNVGLGVTPDAASGSYLQFASGYFTGQYGVGRNSYYDGSNFKAIYTGGATLMQGGDNHLFYTAASVSADATQTVVERMRLTNAGDLLVGSTSTDPIANNSNSTQIAADGFININRANNPSFYIGRSGSDGIAVGFYKGTTSVGSISLTGSNTAYNTSSDYRLKTNAQPMTGASDRVLALNPVNFEWIADGTRVDGFLAHEAQAVVPEAVTGTKDAMRDEEYQVSAATGDIYTAGAEAGFNEVSAAIEASPAYYDVDGNIIKAEVIAQAAVHEAYDAVDEVIHSADVEQPETLADGQQWRETTAAVMGTRSVPAMQGIDQSKMVPLLVAALQEALARITALENE